MIPRTLEDTMGRAMKTFPAVLVTGPRQSGKTTLLDQRFGKSIVLCPLRILIVEHGSRKTHLDF